MLRKTPILLILIFLLSAFMCACAEEKVLDETPLDACVVAPAVQLIQNEKLSVGLDENDVTFSSAFEQAPMIEDSDTVARSTISAEVQKLSLSSLQTISDKITADLKKQASAASDDSGSKVSVSSDTVNVDSLDDISKLIASNKYSTSSITIIQSERGDISENIKALKSAVFKSGNSCSFVAIRLSDGASIGYNADKLYRCASTFKAPTALYVYKLIEEGKVNQYEKIQYKRSYYFSGSGVIIKSSYGTEYTVKTLLDYSLRYSDNIAYTMLRENFSRQGISNMLKSFGVKNYVMDESNWPMVSARDAAIWWNEIFRFSKTGTAGKTLWKLSLDATGDTIARALGREYPVAHKGGSNDAGYNHDTGVIMCDEPYILSIYSYASGTGDENFSYLAPIIREIDKLMNPNS